MVAKGIEVKRSKKIKKGLITTMCGSALLGTGASLT